MATVRIDNPHKESAELHLVGKSGWLGLDSLDRRLAVAAFGAATVDLPKGTYCLRYRHAGAGCACQSGDFTLAENSIHSLTLVPPTGGSYGLHSSRDPL